MKRFTLTVAMLIASTTLVSAYCHGYHNCASHGYYWNSSGHHIHGPDYNTRNVSAHCRDGTLSHSEHHRGTCSSHGGVERWG